MNMNNLIMSMQAPKTESTRDAGSSRKPSTSGSGKSKSFKDVLTETADAGGQNANVDANVGLQDPSMNVRPDGVQNPTVSGSGKEAATSVETLLGGVQMPMGSAPQGLMTLQDVSMMGENMQQTAVLVQTAAQSTVQTAASQIVQTAAAQAPVQQEGPAANQAAALNAEADLGSADGKKTEQSGSQSLEQLSAQTAKQSQEVKPVEVKSESYGLQEDTKGDEKQTNTSLAAAELPKEKVTDEGTMFVKVGKGETVEQPAKFAADLGEKIVYNAANGKQEFDIELTPADLGKINIKLIFESGKATVLLNCTNPQTQQALMANAEQLRHIVEAGTGRYTEVNPQENAGSMGHQNPDQRGENQARDEQQERMTQEHKPDRNQVSMFVDRFRLGLVQKASSL